MIEHALRSGDGRLLGGLLAVERSRLQGPTGSDFGLEKFKPDDSIRALNSPADFAHFLEDCLKAWHSFSGGWELDALLEFFKYYKLKIQPSSTFTARTADDEVDEFLATPEEAKYKAALLKNTTIPDTITTGDIYIGETEIIEEEGADFAQTFPMFTAVEIKVDGQWQAGMTGFIQEHPAEDEAHRVGEVLVYIDKFSDGTKVRQARWIAHDDVRLSPSAATPCNRAAEEQADGRARVRLADRGRRRVHAGLQQRMAGMFCYLAS